MIDHVRNQNLRSMFYKVMVVTIAVLINVAVWLLVDVFYVGASDHSDKAQDRSEVQQIPDELHKSTLIADYAENLSARSAIPRPITKEGTDSSNLASQNLMMPAIPTRMSPWCTGGELVCLIVTTDSPADVIQKLISIIPLDKSRQYKLRVSIIPVSSPPTRASENADRTISGGK